MTYKQIDVRNLPKIEVSKVCHFLINLVNTGFPHLQTEIVNLYISSCVCVCFATYKEVLHTSSEALQ